MPSGKSNGLVDVWKAGKWIEAWVWLTVASVFAQFRYRQLESLAAAAAFGGDNLEAVEDVEGPLVIFPVLSMSTVDLIYGSK